MPCYAPSCPACCAVHHPALCHAPPCPWRILGRALSCPVPYTIVCTVRATSSAPAAPWCAPSATLCLAHGVAVARATRAASCAALRAASHPAGRACGALPTRSSSALPYPPAHAACPYLCLPRPRCLRSPPTLALPPRPGVTRPISASRAGPPLLWLRSLSLSSAPTSPLARRVSTGCPGLAPVLAAALLRVSASLCPSRPPAASLCLCPSKNPAVPMLSPCCPHPGPHGACSPARVSAGGAAPAVRGSRSWVPCVCPPPSYGTLPSRRALKNSRLVSQKDDVHLCIMCLRAIMNYQVPPPHDGGGGHRCCHRTGTANTVPTPSPQYGFNLVMSHPHAVNEIALSLNNKNPR